MVPYFNRKKLLLLTLDSIQRSKVKDDIEVIIVDDGSRQEEAIARNDVSQYDFDILSCRVDPVNKSWVNPLVAHNLGISKTNSNWIIIQNGGVAHLGDIPEYVLNKGSPGTYIVFPVFAADKNSSDLAIPMLQRGNEWPRRQLDKKIKGEWYCHQQKNPRPFHFCAAIHRSDLNMIGGFNPLLRNGVDYDDDEFVMRVQRVCKIAYAPINFVGLHLWHPKIAYDTASYEHLGLNKTIEQLRAKNKHLTGLLARQKSESSFVKIDDNPDYEKFRCTLYGRK